MKLLHNPLVGLVLKPLICTLGENVPILVIAIILYFYLSTFLVTQSRALLFPFRFFQYLDASAELHVIGFQPFYILIVACTKQQTGSGGHVHFHQTFFSRFINSTT